MDIAIEANTALAVELNEEVADRLAPLSNVALPHKNQPTKQNNDENK